MNKAQFVLGSPQNRAKTQGQTTPKSWKVSKTEDNCIVPKGVGVEIRQGGDVN